MCFLSRTLMRPRTHPPQLSHLDKTDTFLSKIDRLTILAHRTTKKPLLFFGETGQKGGRQKIARGPLKIIGFHCIIQKIQKSF